MGTTSPEGEVPYQRPRRGDANRSVRPAESRWLPVGDAAVVTFGHSVAGGHPEDGEQGQAGDEHPSSQADR